MKCLTVLAFIILGAVLYAGEGTELQKANEELLLELQRVNGLTDSQLDSLRAIFRRSGYIGQGNPQISIHPVSREECRDSLVSSGVDYQDLVYLEICGFPYMAPLYDPEEQRIEDARACIDQFEFPNIACEYPVVWVRANEAARICEILGKRICDAHEWEGACAGALLPADYRFDLALGRSPSEAIALMRKAHNAKWGVDKDWAYGQEYQSGICATASRKSARCDGGSWSLCGSNTYPSGFFRECVSPQGVYDLHGNAAEHMNLPLDSSQMSSLGSKSYGYTEMKGSWFVFDSYRAHDDWCRWRAPFWHGGRLLSETSHRNYHLGFRCCCDVENPDDE